MGEGVLEVGKEGDYIPVAPLSPPERLLHEVGHGPTDRDKQHSSPMLWIAPRGHSQTTRAVILTDSNELAAKSEK